jgi:butyryl-CoA dehydrogenase
MPDSIFPNGDTLIVDMIRRFSQERLAPLAAEREKKQRIEPEIIAELGELGVFGATTPAEWDGSELDPVTYAMLLEEIAAGDGSVSTMVSVHNSPTCIVVNNHGTNAQKDRWLRKLATGAHVGSFGLTEPQAGSDASNLKTRAVKKGDRYIVNGAKQFISNAAHPGSLVFFAVTDPGAGKKGLSCFVIDKTHPGFSISRTEEKLGQKASDTCALAFEDMEVPEDQRIGAEGEGGRVPIGRRQDQAGGGAAVDAVCGPVEGRGTAGLGSGLHGEVVCVRGGRGDLYGLDSDLGRIWVPGGLSGGADLS